MTNRKIKSVRRKDNGNGYFPHAYRPFTWLRNDNGFTECIPEEVILSSPLFEVEYEPEPKIWRQEGTYEGEIRATFIVNEAKLEKLKALAYLERKRQKDLIDQAIDMLLQSTNPELLERAITEFSKSNIKAR